MRTALHTISYSGSWGQAALSLEATIERAGTLGFDGLMLAAKRPHASLLDMKPDVRRTLRDKMQECGVGLECLAAYTNFTADADHSIGSRQESALDRERDPPSDARRARVDHEKIAAAVVRLRAGVRIVFVAGDVGLGTGDGEVIVWVGGEARTVDGDTKDARSKSRIDYD